MKEIQLALVKHNELLGNFQKQFSLFLALLDATNFVIFERPIFAPKFNCTQAMTQTYRFSLSPSIDGNSIESGAKNTNFFVTKVLELHSF